MSIRFKKTNKEIEVKCYKKLNFLAHSQLEELHIGSICGGFGECGGDRIQFSLKDRPKLSPPSPAEKEHLSPEEIEQGWRLACQCYPSDDDLDFEVWVPNPI